MADKFDEVINVFPEHIRKKLKIIPENIKQTTHEIRVRCNKPLVLTGTYGTAFIGVNSVVSHMDVNNSIVISQSELNEITSAVCGYSIYSHQTDIANGFVTYGSGNRVGFCGTAVIHDNKVTAISNVSSLNIRIAREFNNAADEILNTLYKNKMPKGLILAGPPCSGKTTLLKSMALRLSSEYRFGFKKCVIVDERFEMSNSGGINCDILSGYDKETGIIHAIRTLSPQIIICDEIASEYESERIIKGLDSGVNFIVSIHAADKYELLRRHAALKLFDSGGFDYVAILDNSMDPGSLSEIIKTEELVNENFCSGNDSYQFRTDSIYNCAKRKKA